MSEGQERAVRFWKIRCSSGLTYVEMGKMFGVSTQRARALAVKGERICRRREVDHLADARIAYDALWMKEEPHIALRYIQGVCEQITK